MAIYRWDGSASDKDWENPANWTDSGGGTPASYPGDGDTVLFDRAVDDVSTDYPGSNLNQSDITLKQLTVGPEYNSKIGSSPTNALEIGAEEVRIDASSADNIYLSSLPIRIGGSGTRTISVRKDGTGDYQTVQAAYNSGYINREIYVYQGDTDGNTWTQTVYNEQLTLDDSDGRHIIAVGDVVLSGTTDGLIRTNGDSATIIEGFKLTGGQTTGHGGGIYVKTGDSITLRNCEIYDNSADYGQGGGVYAAGDITLIDCQIHSNTATAGAGIYIGTTGTYQIERCRVYNNSTTGNGGGAHVTGTTAQSNIVNCLFYDNSAHRGGAVYFNDADVIDVLCCTFVNNTVTTAGREVYITGDTDNVGPDFDNCIFGSTGWNVSSSGEIYVSTTMENPTIDYCDVEGSSDGIAYGGTALVLGSYTNNINSDPLFVGSGNDPYDIDDNSPCIDAGTTGTYPVLDIIHRVRFPSGSAGSAAPDIGAYEWGDKPAGSTSEQALQQPSYNWYHKWGSLVVTDMESSHTAYLFPVADVIYLQKGTINLSEYGFCTSGLYIGYQTSPPTDVTVTFESDGEGEDAFYPSSTVTVFGGNVISNSQCNEIVIMDGQWTQQNHRNVAVLDMLGGIFDWRSGNIGEATLHTATFDGSQSVQVREIGSITAYQDTIVNLDDNVGNITVTGNISIWGDGLSLPSDSTVTVGMSS